MDEVTFIEFDDDESAIVLLDGRRMTVNPGDISIAILWSPTSALEVSKADDGRFFDLSVKHQMTGQEIRARWE